MPSQQAGQVLTAIPVCSCMAHMSALGCFPQFEKVENKPVVIAYIIAAFAAFFTTEWLIHLPALDIVSAALWHEQQGLHPAVLHCWNTADDLHAQCLHVVRSCWASQSRLWVSS